MAKTIKNTTIFQIIYLVLLATFLTACNQKNQESSPSSAPSVPSVVESLTPLSQNPQAPQNSQDELSTTFRTLKTVRGQSIYVPAYSHIYASNGERSFLAITLSIRNTSITDSIAITSVRYYNSNGKLVKEYTKKKLLLSPLATAEFFIQENDSSGGSGANFIVEWTSDKNVTEPVVEAVMIATRLQQGISFTSPGRVIEELISKPSTSTSK